MNYNWPDDFRLKPGFKVKQISSLDCFEDAQQRSFPLCCLTDITPAMCETLPDL